jgi:hypothetical protein
VALVCSSEDNCDRFYGKLLELTRLNSKILPAALSRQIFNLDSELTIINYADDNIHFEIFINGRDSRGSQKIEHVCLEIAGLEGFLEKCRAMEVDVLQIPKGDKMLVFIRDFDGNLFELKPKT